MARKQFTIAPSGMKDVAAVSADSTHAFGRHTHDQFGIGVILRGAQKSLSGRGTVEAEAGDVITVNPGEVHDGLPLGEQGRAWQMLYFDPDTLAGPIGMVTKDGCASSELAFPVLRDPTSAVCFSSLYRSITDPDGGYSEIEASQALLLLLSKIVDRRDQERPCGSGTIGRARERIDDDPSLPLSLEELAAIAGISQFQLVRGFSKTVGLTPHAYLVQRRLQMARKLIVNGASLADAAISSGFADQSHMTRLFARTYGMPPGTYAAAMRRSAISFKTC